MSTGERLRVPAENGGLLFEPGPEQLRALIADNDRRLVSPSGKLFGRPWQEVRRQARAEALAAARAYLEERGEPLPDLRGNRIILSGHQPELFHPGVWVKNFALHGLAQTLGGVGVNLIVDNDALKLVSLPVPRVALPLSPDAEPPPHVEPVPFDNSPLGIPYEEWRARDEELFASLPERVGTGWGFTPLLGRFWAEASAVDSPSMTDRLTVPRRAVERGWGCHNLEVPASRLCETESFAYFALHLLLDLPRFHRAHNEALRDHRRSHGIKSRHHPVPDLAREGDWLEAPFWVWRAGDQRRSRLLVRRNALALETRLGEEEGPNLPTGDGLLAAWRRVAEQGVKVRVRALTNTLYCRLFVGDLFVHGIGGGRYDELTDEIVRRYFEIEPPRFLIVSGTLRLPLPSYPVDEKEVRQLEHRLRDLDWNPQRHLAAVAPIDPIVADLASQKDGWIARRVEGREGSRQRCQTLRSLTVNLRPAVEDRRRRVEEELSVARRQSHANAILKRRDYPFCLYPESDLRAFCLRAMQRAREID